ncbi:condensation domain-containing protein [Mucilaginibacter psychrotolerans]|uniref:Condensation domain-containing protein n=1 Tax=Mucilaginibacter psychrotolerans TaxID=1524096 RepID=A0A4Y8SH58_9SPHI|nr:condensation domain-containing protein [Mucilaginibacter psychrotolerans]TFF37784.1 hypothetical protein E2R66_11500 [Mucilaginibacter psychrotolerans]
MPDLKGRPFGAVEKLYLALDEIAVKTFALVAELDNRIPDEAVGPAFEALARQHAQLNYRIAEDSHFQFWFLNSHDRLIPYRIIPAGDDRAWTAVLAEELIKPFDLSKAPLIRIIILQKQYKSILMILSHHSLGDGISAYFLMQDFLKILSGLKLDCLTLPKSMDGLLEEVTEQESYFIPASSGTLRERSYNNSVRIFIDKVQLSEALTASIQQRSRAEGTTVNSALNAAVAIALNKLSEVPYDRPLVARLPVSARNVLGLQREFVLNVITKNVSMQPVNDDNFWVFARWIGSELKSAASIDEVKAYVRYFRNALLQPVAFSHIVKGVEERIQTDFMLSNLGRVQEDASGIYQIKTLWGPIVISGTGAEQTVGAVTIGGRLSMTNTSFSHLPGLLKETVDILAGAVKQ